MKHNSGINKTLIDKIQPAFECIFECQPKVEEINQVDNQFMDTI